MPGEAFAQTPQNDAGAGTDAPNDAENAWTTDALFFSGTAPADPSNPPYDVDWYRLPIPSGLYTRLHLTRGTGEYTTKFETHGTGTIGLLYLGANQSGVIEIDWLPTPATSFLLEIAANGPGPGEYFVEIEHLERPDIHVRDLELGPETSLARWALNADFREISFVVANEGNGPAYDVQLSVLVQGMQSQRMIESTVFDMPANKALSFVLAWDDFAQVGDFEIVVTARSWADSNLSGQVARARASVVTSAPVGVDLLAKPAAPTTVVDWGYSQGAFTASVRVFPAGGFAAIRRVGESEAAMCGSVPSPFGYGGACAAVKAAHAPQPQIAVCADHQLIARCFG